MRTFSTIAATVAMIFTVCCVNVASAQWPQYTQGVHQNSIEIGGRAYNRPGSKLQIPLVTDSVTGQTFFDANQATAVSSAPGVELSYNFDSRFGRKLEFRTIMASFDTSTFLDEANMVSPLFPGANPATIDYNYESSLFSFELNASRPLMQGVTLFAGPRFMRFNDQTNIVSTGLVDPGQGVPTFTATDRRSFEAINNLIGGQLGINADFQLTQSFRIRGFLRAGGYMNPTKVNFFSSQTALGQTNQLDALESTKSTGSFLAETGAKLFVDIRPGALQAYGGYEATWIDGIALAPPQFLTVDQQGVQTANTLFMHAITFGLKFTF